MKRLFTIMLCIVSLLLTVSLSSAEQRQKVKVKRLTGEVVVYDQSIKTMTVKGKRLELIIVLDNKTTIKSKKSTKTLSDINLGDIVTVRYIEKGDKNLALSIEIHNNSK